ncbi:MAG: prepilin-type N-terminal cleavage/methylation domain-containing protein [Nitrospirota bacterium]
MTRVRGQGATVKFTNGGFTLLEVMVAVSIMATVLVILLGLQSRTMQDVAQAEQITTATLLAKRMMVDVIVSKNWLPVEETGDFKDEDKFKDYAWKKTLSQIPLFSTVFITEIRIAVLWKEGTHQEMVELVDYE